MNTHRLVILWIILIIGMILHFNYHVSEIFYGIDIVKPESNGEVPIGVFIIRSVFYHLPVFWILILLYFHQAWIKLSLFIISVLYTVSHLVHLIGELANKSIDPSQISLLSIVSVVALILTYEHYKYWKIK